MENVFLVPENPMTEKDFNEDEILNVIFPLKFPSFENVEEMNEDNLYIFNISLFNEKNKKNESINDDEVYNTILLTDDYEAAFNKLSSPKTNNSNSEESNLNTYYNNEKEDICRPSFFKNIIRENKSYCQDNEQSLEFIIKVEESKQITNNNKSKIKNKILESNSLILKIGNKRQKPKIKERSYIRGPYKKKQKEFQQVDTNNDYFPFKKGKSMVNNIFPIVDPLRNNNHEIDKDNFLISEFDFEDEKEQDITSENCLNKKEIEFQNNSTYLRFKTKKYIINEKGKKKTIKKTRKFKPDDIRKKIKARFHKLIKNIINENLKRAGSKELFDFLPQSFIGNISRKLNKKWLYMTYKEILSTNDNTPLNKYYETDKNKFNKNQKVLKYLEENPQIVQRAGFDIVQNMKYKDILSLYFSSSQFDDSIMQLKNEKENYNYIQEYIYLSKTYIKFFDSYGESEI